MQPYEAKIAALERLVGRQALEIEFLKGAQKKQSATQERIYVRDCRPLGMSVARGCELMGLSRSTYYDARPMLADDTEIISRIRTVCDEFETYGYRDVRGGLR